MRATLYKKALIVLGLVVILFSIFFLMGDKKDNERNEVKDEAIAAPWVDAETSKLVEEEFGPEVETSDWSVVDMKKYGFRFKHPRDMKVGSFPQGEGEVIVVQNAAKKIGFQIYIQSIAENIDITAKRIRNDIPELAISDVRPLELGGGSKGISFLSNNKEFGGNSREAWFTRKGNLFQVSTYTALDPMLGSVLDTWEFYK